MGTSSINSLLSSLGSSTNESLSQLLGQTGTSGTASASASENTAIQEAVNAILNSATQTSGSGINVQSTVDAILQIDAVPEQNLANQVTALNSQTSALQTIESDLAALQTSVQALTDPTGAFSATTVSSSDNTSVSATAASGAEVGTHTVVVNNLATNAADYSNYFTSTTPFPTTGSLTIQVGSNSPTTINIDTNDGTNTASGLAAYITQHVSGVTATAVTDSSGTRLALVSQTSGTPGDLTITDNTGASGSAGLGFTKATDGLGDVLGANASITVDGVPYSSSTNTVTGAIPGVTLTLSGVSTDPVTVQVQPDLNQVSTVINNFVSAYNQVITDINNQYNYNGTQSSAPVLLGDPSLDLVQSQLLSAVTTSITGNSGLVNLQSIGIQQQADGTLKVASNTSTDSMDLNDALTNDFSAVQNLFQSSSGVATILNSNLTALTNSVSGPLNLDMTGITSEVTDLNSQITDFQTQLQQTQTQLTAEYSTINTTLEQLPQTLASINSQLDALNPSKSS